MMATIYLDYKRDLNKIIYSENFRSLQNKTQLFYYEEGNHYRTRLTHTIEVEKIAYNIAIGLNNKITENQGANKLDLTLVQAIALAHDIGHTPFGHVGERVIDSILSRKDTIGLLNSDHKNLIFFKHNVNSLKILKNLINVKDYRIIDGACKHTHVKKKDYDYGANNVDPYNLNDFYKGIYKTYATQEFAFTLEGQVVAIADEIAQRISDIDDILDNRHIDKIKKFLPGNSSKSKQRVEELIYNNFVQDVIDNTFNKISNKNNNGFYGELVVCFSDNYKKCNNQIDNYIKYYIALSEKVRVSDSNSKHILRQLFKAYYNDITLLPDNILMKYFNKIRNKISNIKDLLLKDNALKDIEKLPQNIKDIIENNMVLNYDTKKLDMNKVISFHAIIKAIESNSNEKDILCVVNDYLEVIGSYIASLNDNDARYLFKKFYK